YAADLSTRTPILEGQLTGLTWQDQYNIKLTIVMATGEERVCTPNYWYQSARVAIDLTSGRRIRRLTYQSRPRTEEALDEIIRNKYKLLVYGERSPDKC